MPVVMKIVGIAGMEQYALTKDTQYLKTWDNEANGGRGAMTTTPKLEDAAKFATLAEAMQAWQGQSKTVPFRDDGKPNRPLTGFTVEMIQVP